MEREEELASVSHKHLQDVNGIKYQVKDLESRKMELEQEVAVLKLKINLQEDTEDLKEQITRVKLKYETSEHKNLVLSNEMDRLKEECYSVSLLISCLVPASAPRLV